MKQETYIVVSKTEIVKAEIEKPVMHKHIEVWEQHCLSLPRIPIQGKHNWKVWQEVEEGKDFRFGLSDYTTFNLDAGREEGRPTVAIPIEQTKSEGEKVEDKKTFFEWLNNNRLFFVDEVRGWLKMVDSGDISFSKFVELFNEKVFKSGYAAAPKGMRGNIITDEQLDKAWGYANFGTTPKRRVVSEALEKITQGYHNGRTATAIIEELGLVECREKGRYYVLTDLGLKYLRAHEPPDSEAGYGWISVNERLPADNEDYEVWVKGNIIPIIAHYLSKKYFSDNYDDENYMEEGWYYSHAYNFHSPEFTLDVTHWRPLPQPPSNPISNEASMPNRISQNDI